MDEKQPLEQSSNDQQLGPPPLVDPLEAEVQRKKRRKKIIIIILIVFGGIILVLGIFFGILFLVGQTISGMCESLCKTTCDCQCINCCDQCLTCEDQCGNCGQGCSDSCRCDCGSDNIVNAQTGDSNFDSQIFTQYIWETLKDWFHNLFS